MLPRGHVRPALLGLCFLPCLGWAGDFADPPPTYRTTASEVRVTFFTTDERKRPVDMVKKQDFAVVDNEIVVRNFRSFTRSDETTLDVVALVDASESVAPRVRIAIEDVRQLLARERSISDDRISVVSFSGPRPTSICSGDCRNSNGAARLQTVASGGVTPLFDALAYGADLLSRRRSPGVRPLLILFSDGIDTISRASANEALTKLIASGTLVYSVDLSNGQNSNGSALLQYISEATGGRHFPVRAGPANVLDAALEDLRSSYVVTYALPSHAVGFHSLRILPTHNLNLRFHSRNGYYYENEIR